MRIYLTEKELTECISKIITECVGYKIKPDSFDDRSYDMITEGLIMSYAPDRLIRILKRKFDFTEYNASVTYLDRTQENHPISRQKKLNKPVNTTNDYSNLIEVYIVFNRGLSSVNKDILNSIIHVCDACGWFFASIQDAYTLQEFKKVEDCDYTVKHAFRMYFRPKYDQVVNINGIPDNCYHICPSRLVPKILRQGLKPKDYGRTSNHPERVFLFFNKPFDWKQIADRFRESREEEPYSLLCIDMRPLLDKFDFRFDSLTMIDNPAVYTTETIPPSNISVVEEEK